MENGEFNGWDWNDAGNFDPTTDPEGTLQVIIDAVASQLGLL